MTGTVRVPLTLEVLRRRAGLSQWELACRISRFQSDVSYYENGVTPIPPEVAEGCLLLFTEIEATRCLVSGLKGTDLQLPWEDVVAREDGG